MKCPQVLCIQLYLFNYVSIYSFIIYLFIHLLFTHLFIHLFYIYISIYLPFLSFVITDHLITRYWYTSCIAPAIKSSRHWFTNIFSLLLKIISFTLIQTVQMWFLQILHMSQQLICCVREMYCSIMFFFVRFKFGMQNPLKWRLMNVM